MKMSQISIAIALALALNGCSSLQTSKPAPIANTQPIAADTAATVNGKAISRELLNTVISDLSRRSEGRPVPEDKILEALIARELLQQEAERLNLTQQSDTAAKLENARRDVLVQAMVENLRKTLSVSEDELKKSYAEQTATGAPSEYKARHILLDNEADAKAVIAKLNKGAQFEALAKKRSKDPSAAQNGGDLGWFNAQQMAPEFSAAVAELKNGETSKTPVKTQFGWHVINRQDSREQAPPPYEAVKEQIQALLINKKVQEHVEQMKASAKIERFPRPQPAASQKSEQAVPAVNPLLKLKPPAEPSPLEAGKPASANPSQ